MRKSRAFSPPRSSDFARAHEGKALVGEVFRGIDDFLEQVPRLRPGDRELRPLVGNGRQLHVEFGEQHLPAEFEMLHHRPGLGRGGGQEIMILGEPRRGAVVIDDAVLAQHQPVARLADGEVGEGVDVDAVEEGAGIRAMHVDLAERRDVAEADAAAHRLDLARHRFQPVLLACDTDTTARASTGRCRRRPRPAPPPSDARASAASRGNSRRDGGRPARRWRPAHRAGGRSSCRSRGSSGRSARP